MSNPIKNDPYDKAKSQLNTSDPKSVKGKEGVSNPPSPEKTFDSFHPQHNHEHANSKKTQHDSQIMAGISAVKGMLMRIYASFASSASNVNSMFRIALNSAAHAMLQTAASIVQSVLDLAVSSGSNLQTGARGLYASISILLGITKENMEEQKNNVKSNQELSKGTLELAKKA